MKYWFYLLSGVFLLIGLVPYLVAIRKPRTEFTPFYESLWFCIGAIIIAIILFFIQICLQENEEKQKNTMQSNIDVHRSQIKEAKKEISLLKIENNLLEKKLGLMTKNISTFHIRYSVHFKDPNNKILYSENELLTGGPLVYAQIGTNIRLKASGIAYRFGQSSDGWSFIEVNAQVLNGEYPLSSPVESLKHEIYKNITLYLPFYLAQEQDKTVLIKNVSINIAINGISITPIIRFDQLSIPIQKGLYEDNHRRIWGVLDVHNEKNIFEMYQDGKRAIGWNGSD